MRADSSKKGIVGLLTDFRSTLGHEGHGLNLFVLDCIEAAGKVCNSMDEVAAALAEWRIEGAIPTQSSFIFVFTQRIGEQSAGIGPPGCFGIA
jgi:hypothetical protein